MGIIYFEIGQNWPNQQCCLAGFYKTAPRILIFSIATGAEYLFYVKFIATYAITFFGYIDTVLASVLGTKIYWHLWTPKRKVFKSFMKKGSMAIKVSVGSTL